MSIETIERHAESIRNGSAKVHPGQPHVISEAATVGDGVWQGDLGIEIVASVPSGYAMVKKPTEADKQLVPGNTQGAKHCLASLSGVKLYRPTEWGPNYDGLHGPALELSKPATITHPTHGDVTIPAGSTVLCHYQREWDQEQKRERRNAD